MFKMVKAVVDEFHYFITGINITNKKTENIIVTGAYTQGHAHTSENNKEGGHTKENQT